MKKLGLCLNWKVVGGLAVAGLALWTIAPQAVGRAAPLLLLLVCPLSMVFMMRGMGGQSGQSGASCHTPQQKGQEGEVVPQPLGEKKTLLARMQEQQESLQAEIVQLEAGVRPNGSAPTVTGPNRAQATNGSPAQSDPVRTES